MTNKTYSSAPLGSLPAARREQILLFELANIQPAHGLAQLLVRFEHRFGIFKVRGRFHDGLRARLRIAGLENPRPYKYRFRTQLAHQRCISRSRDSTR